MACITSYQNCGHDISIPLDGFLANAYFLTDCDYHAATALVGRAPGLCYCKPVGCRVSESMNVLLHAVYNFVKEQ